MQEFTRKFLKLTTGTFLPSGTVSFPHLLGEVKPEHAVGKLGQELPRDLKTRCVIPGSAQHRYRFGVAPRPGR